MGRPHAPQIKEVEREDGTRKFTFRPMVNGDRKTVQLGDERDGVTRLQAEQKRKDILEEIRLGRWEPDEPTGTVARGAEPALAVVASSYLDFKRASQLRDNTINYLEWAVETHLVPFFGRKRPSKITPELVVAYSNHQLDQRVRIAALRDHGKYLTGPKGGVLRELSERSINDTLQVLTDLLNWAAARGWGDGRPNPARGFRLKVKPRLIAALEPDELADLMAAVTTPRPRQRQCAATAARADLIVRLRDDDKVPWKAVAELADCSVPTAIYHYQQRKDGTRFAGNLARARADEALVMALARTGARVTEMCKLNVGDVHLAHAKLDISDSKTKTGVRVVDMTPELVAVVRAYFKSRGRPAQTDPAFPDANGKRRNKDQVNKQVLVPAVRLANELRAERGASPVPPVTPHVLRRTYITLAFEARFTVGYVMQQVGHKDSRTTHEIYEWVSARRDRTAQGGAFDRLLAEGSGDRRASGAERRESADGEALALAA